jgi:Domain of unknown function (DUF4037)
MGETNTGLALAAAFYRDVVAPLLTGVPHGAALLGEGSEVLGYDDAVSTDHDFGPRVQIFVPAAADIAPAEALLTGRLPATFGGFPVAYVDQDRHGGAASHQVEVTTAARFFTERLGVDPAGGMRLGDWLVTPTQRFATLTAGAVFADPDSQLELRRHALRWYPDDVWRYALAAAWLRVDQEEPFVARTGSTGDDLGSRLLTARLVRDLMRVAFLVERRWAPYPKWFGRAFGELAVARRIGPDLSAALAASGWREREAALVRAGSALIAATNDLGLGPPVDPAPRSFHDRDIRVVGPSRVTVALTGAITDPDVVRLLEAQGRRPRTSEGRYAGTVDLAVDSTEILTDRDRWRTGMRALLGLPREEPG